MTALPTPIIAAFLNERHPNVRRCANKLREARGLDGLVQTEQLCSPRLKLQDGVDGSDVTARSGGEDSGLHQVEPFQFQQEHMLSRFTNDGEHTGQNIVMRRAHAHAHFRSDGGIATALLPKIEGLGNPFGALDGSW